MPTTVIKNGVLVRKGAEARFAAEVRIEHAVNVGEEQFRGGIRVAYTGVDVGG